MALNLTLLVAIKESDEFSQHGVGGAGLPGQGGSRISKPWLTAGWPVRPVIWEQRLTEGESGYHLLGRLIGAAGELDFCSADVARLSAAADGLQADPTRWRADPVSLIPDRDQLVVIPGKLAELSMAEARSLVAILNRHFVEDFTIEVGAPHRWYLTPTQPLELSTYSLDAAAGGSAGVYQAQGSDAMLLQRWLNEIQMALFDAPSNEERELRDHWLINSVWLWGNSTSRIVADPGEIPGLVTVNDYPDLIMADSGWASALGQNQGVPVLPVVKPENLAEQLPATGHLLVDLARVDGDRLPDEAEAQAWCRELQPLMGRQIDQVTLYAIERGGWSQQQWRARDFGFLSRWLSKLRPSSGSQQP